MSVNHQLRNPFGLSVLLHGLLFALFIVYAQTHPLQLETKSKQWTWIEVEALPKPTVKTQKDNEKRVVQTRTVEKSEEVAPDAFLGQQNQIVDRQTVGKTQTMGTSAKPKSAPSAEKAKELAKKDIESVEKAPTLGSLGVALIPKSQPKQAKSAEPERNWANTSDGTPSDYVKGMKESDSTALNTREFVFYGYFQRIRQSLDRAWNENLKENMAKFYRRGRQLASEMDHTTKVVVILNSSGEVTKVQVIEESGTVDLDDAAVRAFNSAGPFPNPPKGLLDARGQIEIKWDFVLRT